MTLLLLLHEKNIAVLAMVGALSVALLAFIIGWRVSEFFIPPRFNWSKSPFSVLMIKLGIAANAAFWSFIFIIWLLDTQN